MTVNRVFIILGLIVTGLVTRLIPHPPNFTSLLAIAFFGSISLGSSFLSFAVTISVMVLTDLILGFHPMVSFVYLSYGLVAYLGFLVKNQTLKLSLPVACLISSILFFVVTNFGEWAFGPLYSKDLVGFLSCYIAAIPFFTNQLFGDLFYSFVLWSILRPCLSETKQGALDKAF